MHIFIGIKLCDNITIHLQGFLTIMSNPWIFEADQLLRTPSSDRYNRKEENELRIAGARFIHTLGLEALKLHYCTVATGAVFFHRFYMFHSFAMFPVYPMAATCLFLAGKVEETPKKSNDIVKFSKTILGEDKFKQFGADPKEEILTLERILLQTLRFDLEVEHPYDHLIKYVKHFTVVKKDQAGNIIEQGETTRKGLVQSAWTFLNDSSGTTVCLRYEPEIVAIAVIHLACKTGAYVIADWENRQPDHKHWWDVYVENLEEETPEEICHLVLDVYQPPPSD